MKNKNFNELEENIRKGEKGSDTIEGEKKSKIGVAIYVGEGYLRRDLNTIHKDKNKAQLERERVCEWSLINGMKTMV